MSEQEETQEMLDTAGEGIGTVADAFGFAGDLVEGAWNRRDRQPGRGWPRTYRGHRDVLSDGLLSLVGEEDSLAAANAFDDGEYLEGVGHMLSGAGSTIYDAGSDAVWKRSATSQGC